MDIGDQKRVIIVEPERVAPRPKPVPTPEPSPAR
jgi:hypothetical protein